MVGRLATLKLSIIMNYKFILQPYKGPASKQLCPSCGRRSFKLYIDTETGMAVDSTCGICDHVQSCGYHLPPKAYFADHPQGRQRRNDLGRLLEVCQPVGSPAVVAPAKAAPLSNTLLGEYKPGHSTFHTWLSRIGIAAEDIIHPLGVTRAGETVFWLMDAQQNLLDGKVILYGADGHRVHQPEGSRRTDVNWISTALKQQKRLDWSMQTRKCFYGENLLKRYPERAVCIVESEKSAIVMQHLYPDYLWLATGGCSMLRNLDLAPLAGRHVTVFPDAGMLTKWQEYFLGQTVVTNYRFYTALEAMDAETGEALFAPNTDIVDVWLSAGGRKEARGDTTS